MKSTEEILSEHVKLLSDIVNRNNREITQLFERVRRLEEKVNEQAD